MRRWYNTFPQTCSLNPDSIFLIDRVVPSNGNTTDHNNIRWFCFARFFCRVCEIELRPPQTMKHDPKRVALVSSRAQVYDGKFIAGVATYLKRGVDWEIEFVDSSSGARSLKMALKAGLDGIIANLRNSEIASIVGRSGVPAIAYGSRPLSRGKSPIRHIGADESKAAHIVADHLLGSGYQNFGFTGYRKTVSGGCSEDLGRHFKSSIAAAGFPLSTYVCDEIEACSSKARSELQNWLLRLPKPVGIFAASDQLAHKLSEMCRRLEIPIPLEVGIVGVDNDEVLCQLSSPPLTSVDTGARSAGLQAAALLERMMDGDLPERELNFGGVTGLALRQSTRQGQCNDPVVDKALRYIRENCSEDLSPNAVSEVVGRSRSSLESKFKSELGRSIFDCIRSERITRAEQLLRLSDLPIKQVADQCGFSSVPHMTTLFKQFMGCTPASFQKGMKLGVGEESSPLVAVA